MTGISLCVAGDDLLGHAEVGGGADEGKRDRIHSVAETEFEVLAIFIGQRRNGKCNAGKVDPFVFAQHAAVENIAQHVVSPNAAYAQLNQTVTEQDAGAGHEFAGQVGERGGDARGRSRHILRSDGHD